MERKKSKKGTSQRAILCKIDNELLDWLQSHKNKNRYINELIRRDMEASGGDYAASVEAEKQRQAAELAGQQIDGSAIMPIITRKPTDVVLLFTLPGTGRYDALFADARRVKQIIPEARITTAEAEEMNIANCLLARIDEAALEKLKAAGQQYIITQYPTK